ELRVGQLDRDDRGQALAHVLAGEVLFLLFQQLLVARVPVDDRGERRAEALLVSTALGRVDRVRERVHRLGERTGPLHRDLDRDPVAFFLEVDDRGVHRVLGGVDVPDEVRDAAGVLVAVGARVVRVSLVGDRDGEVLVEERHLLHPPGERLIGPLGGLEDRAVRPEDRRVAALARRLAAGDRAGRLTLLVGLAPQVAVPAYLDGQPAGQGVHHAEAATVQTAGHRVGLAVELAAGVQ